MVCCWSSFLPFLKRRQLLLLRGSPFLTRSFSLPLSLLPFFFLSIPILPSQSPSFDPPFSSEKVGPPGYPSTLAYQVSTGLGASFPTKMRQSSPVGDQIPGHPTALGTVLLLPSTCYISASPRPCMLLAA